MRAVLIDTSFKYNIYYFLIIKCLMAYFIKNTQAHCVKYHENTLHLVPKLIKFIKVLLGCGRNLGFLVDVALGEGRVWRNMFESTKRHPEYF